MRASSDRAYRSIFGTLFSWVQIVCASVAGFGMADAARGCRRIDCYPPRLNEQERRQRPIGRSHFATT